MKGAPENIIRQCTSYYKDGAVVPLTAKDVERNGDAVMAMSTSGLRGIIYNSFQKCLLFKSQTKLFEIRV